MKEFKQDSACGTRQVFKDITNYSIINMVVSGDVSSIVYKILDMLKEKES